MPQELFTICEYVNIHNTGIAAAYAGAHSCAMEKRFAAIGKRLVALREALGISQAELCRQIGIATNRYSQYETGERQITLAVATKLADEFGVTLDWIYRNDRGSLPQELRAKLPRAA